LIARAADLRPSLAHPRVGELGHRLGSARWGGLLRQRRGLRGRARPTPLGAHQQLVS